MAARRAWATRPYLWPQRSLLSPAPWPYVGSRHSRQRLSRMTAIRFRGWSEGIGGTMKTHDETKKTAIDLPSWLAYAYKPILPYLKQIKIVREEFRRHNPDDILLPQGYVAEVIATGFNAPVHCCFDDQGFCYVSEAGHKIDSKPRILKVNVRTGTYETFYELPPDRWIK